MKDESFTWRYAYSYNTSNKRTSKVEETTFKLKQSKLDKYHSGNNTEYYFSIVSQSYDSPL